MHHARHAALAFAVATAFSLAPLAAGARNPPPGQAAHRLFGRVVAIDGRMLTIQLRGGGLVRVDATRAFELGRVAAPLFRTKPVVVDGAFAGTSPFAATAVKRAAPQPGAWGPDR